MIPKFRTWNSETKEIEVFKTYEEISELFLALSADGGFYSIMQSTGLKDKNGKEIFEGDIITNGQNVMCMKRHNTLGFYVEEKGEVEFIADSAVLEDFEEDAKEIADRLEIIGNIYENTELLEVTE